MPTRLEEAAHDAARDLLITHILSLLANAAAGNPLRWLDAEADRLAVILSGKTIHSARDEVPVPTDDATMGLIKAHLAELFDRTRALQSDAAKASYQTKLTVTTADPGEK